MTPPTEPTADLAGRLETISILDVCQFLMINRRTGVLTVSAEGTHRLLFLEGQIQDATGPGLSRGWPALRKVLGLRQGTFAFRQEPVAPVGAFRESTDSLLLEAVRQMDEGRAGEEGDAVAAARERMERLAQLLARDVKKGSEAAAAAELDLAATLRGWGVRIHYVAAEETLFLEEPPPRATFRRIPAPREALQHLLGPSGLRRLEGARGVVETDAGRLWFQRHGEGPGEVVSVARLQERYPRPEELGGEALVGDLLEWLEEGDRAAGGKAERWLRVPDPLAAALLLGCLLQDERLLGSHPVALLERWPWAWPHGRGAPLWWFPATDAGGAPEALRNLPAAPGLVVAFGPGLAHAQVPGWMGEEALVLRCTTSPAHGGREWSWEAEGDPPYRFRLRRAA
jgi:hypothetical protein